MKIYALLSRQFLIFVAGGLISAVIDICAMQLMIAMDVNPLLAATAGFFLGLFFNYIYHVVLTFESTTTLPVLFRFLVVVGINYIITILLIYISLSILHEGALPGKILSLPIVAANGYLLSKYWVFK
jgi:putative flippase GtrA